MPRALPSHPPYLARRAWRRAAIVAALLPLAALAPAGCAPRAPPPGALTPAVQRTTNEISAADLHTLDGWEGRLRLLQTGPAAAGARPERAYALAKAGAWLTFARDEYARDPRATIADEALAEARRLIELVEAGQEAVALTDETRLVTGTTRVRPDLWEEVGRVKAGPSLAATAATVGQIEVALVRAGRSDPGSDWPACQAPPHLERARTLLADVGARPGPRYVARSPQLANYPMDRSSPLADVPIPSAVHFARFSHRLHPISKRQLDRVVRRLLLDRRLVVVLDGYTDERGSERSNIGLARRRANAVRDYLVTMGVRRSRIRVVAHGETPARDRRSRNRGFALARNVTILVRTPDGGRLPVDSRPLDLQLERRARGTPGVGGGRR